MSVDPNSPATVTNLSHNDGDISADPLLTSREVAQYFKIDEETVRLMARDGKLPAIKVGRLWRFRKSSIQQYLEDRQNTD